MTDVRIYVDGSAKQKKKEFGYGLVVIGKDLEQFGDTFKVLHFKRVPAEDSTNNREEMKAILAGYDFIEENNLLNCVIFSDSAYCVNMINEWIDNWAEAGWRKYDGKEIQNLDLVQQLYEKKHKFSYIPVIKTQGHEGIDGNEMADALATNNLNKFYYLANKFNGLTN